MSKLFTLSAAAIALVCAFAFTKLENPIASPEEDMATVYIYRVGQFNAAAANWAIFADEQKICKLSNNKFIMYKTKPGKHVFTAKIGGVGLMKKETEIEIEAEAGKSYYIACNVKQSFTRSRLELIEVTKSSADKQMAKMSLDNCQENLDAKSDK
jgi:Protein of unknown function (DUF2846).